MLILSDLSMEERDVLKSPINDVSLSSSSTVTCFTALAVLIETVQC